MTDSTIQEIKERLNIAEVIGGYIQMKKAGANFKALCPFHSEKTPSLQISPQKQIWHCFGCGEGGDVISFIQKFENLDFKEALKLAAARAGVELPQYQPTDPKEEDEKDLLFRINDFAARFYHHILINDQRGKEALAYLTNRGLLPQTVKLWQIGFAPMDFHVLENALKQKNISQMDMVKAGVAAKNERGQVYDRFRGRVTFPIFNHFDKIVGFSARILPALDDGKTGKYINSPETAIYNKSQVLFGLNFAKSEIRKQDECIIVEGQMDCISAHQAGILNVVASSGTALTERQLDLLGRLTKNLKFCFDADAAGFLATRRAIDLYLGKDFTIKIIDLSGAKDPDELIKQDREKFIQLIKTAPLFLDYYIEKAFLNFQSQSVEQKKEVAKDVLPLLKSLIDPIEQEHYIRLVAERLGVTEKVVREKLDMIKLPKQPQGAFLQSKGSIKSQSNKSALEKEVFGGMLMYPEFLQEVMAKGSPEDFEDLMVRQEAALAFESKELEKETALAKEAVFMVELLLSEHEGNKEALKKQLLKSFANLRLKAIKKQLERLQADVKRAESASEKNRLQELNQEFARLSNLRIEFERLI
ncbi:MAG: DNA primase [Candidatus Doudnabacteria bacterium]|nr:DNA primase [Candidatus Doudnabacteria bacterium]